MKMTIRSLLIVLFIFCQSGVLGAYDSLEEFNSAWKEWANDWSGSGKDNSSSSGLEIQFSKNIDQKVAQPITLPDASTFVPNFGPYGMNWKADLAYYGNSSVAQEIMDKFSGLFSPDNVDILISVAGSALLEQMGIGSTAQVVNQYIDTAQKADLFLTTLQNHRYELATAMLNNTIPAPNSAEDKNSGLLSINKTLDEWEKNAYELMNKQNKIENNETSDAAKFIEFLSTSSTDQYNAKYSSQINDKRKQLINILKFLYGVSMDQNRIVSMNGVSSIMYSMKNDYSEFYIAYSQEGRENAAIVRKFVNNPKIYKVLEANGILATIRNQRQYKNKSSEPLLETRRKFMIALFQGIVEDAVKNIDDIKQVIRNQKIRMIADLVSREIRNAFQTYVKEG